MNKKAKSNPSPKITLDDVVLYPDEYDFYNHVSKLVPVIMVDGIPRTLTNRELEGFLSEALQKLRKK
jgi:hypothetical protein